MIHWFIHLLCASRRDRPEGKQGMKASWVVYGVRKTMSTLQPCPCPLVPVLTTSSLRAWVSLSLWSSERSFQNYRSLHQVPSLRTWLLCHRKAHFPQASSPTAWAYACFRSKQVSVKEPPRVSVSVVSRSHIPEMLHYLWVKHEPKVLAHLNTQHVLYRNFYLNIRSVGSFESFVCKL